MWEKSSYNTYTAYGQSKLANVLFAYELNRLFKEKGIKASAYSLHPGGIQTNLTRHVDASLWRIVVSLFS